MEAWNVVFLVGGYITLQLIADVCAVKIVDLWGITIPAGTFVFALTFTWRDMLHKRLGRDWARACIVMAGLCNLFMALYFSFAIGLPGAVFWQGQGAFASTLGIVWRIVLASIGAEIISELLDTEVYHRLKCPQFARVLGSNAISLPVDSIIFAFCAFGGLMPFMALLSMVWGQVVFKSLVTLGSLPFIYFVKEKSNG